jgi:hypothetical protein
MMQPRKGKKGGDNPEMFVLHLMTILTIYEKPNNYLHNWYRNNSSFTSTENICYKYYHPKMVSIKLSKETVWIDLQFPEIYIYIYVFLGKYMNRYLFLKVEIPHPYK